MSMSKSNGELSEHVGADVTEDLHRRVRVEAAKRNMSMAEFLRTALRHELERSPEESSE